MFKKILKPVKKSPSLDNHKTKNQISNKNAPTIDREPKRKNTKTTTKKNKITNCHYLLLFLPNRNKIRQKEAKC